MQNIIYKSDNIIPWDTQSAFKMTSYNVSCEENMVFCYMKAYVHKNNLVLCSYCFTEDIRDDTNMHLYINLNPEKSQTPLAVHFGYNGVEKALFNGTNHAGKVGFSSFKTDDEQGFYWCGEITIGQELIKELFGSLPREKSLMTVNMVQTFENGDFAVLFGDRSDEKYIREENTQAFVVLNY